MDWTGLEVIENVLVCMIFGVKIRSVIINRLFFIFISYISEQDYFRGYWAECQL